MEINKIYFEDCLELVKNIDNNFFDLIIIDPPSNGITKELWDTKFKNEDEYVNYVIKCISEFLRVLKETGSLYLFSWIGKKNPITMAKILIELNKLNLIFQNIITWRKDRGYGVKNNWMYVREEILFYTKSKNYYFDVQYSNIKRNYIRKCGKSYYKRCGNVWVDIPENEYPSTNIWDDIAETDYENFQNQEYSLNRNSVKTNYTQKSNALCERIIKSSSKEKDIIFIPFSGSGVFEKVCKRLNRNFIGCELNS